jgi:serine phosphatase RsbU (regulator of sigma subunit)
MHQAGNTTFIAVADCTGHGVPGAFMSLLCNNALNRAILEAGANTPGEILTKARTILLAEFARSQMNLNDGMDVSICAWNADSKQLTWAGANNPLWIQKRHSGEIIELKGDKQPVGNHHDYKDFTTHQVEITSGDRIFLFSDGIPDQFGGPNGKKFKSKQLKEVILNSGNEDIVQQVRTINKKINHWKGDLSQVDDICLLAIEI